jgi:hypothetical protein
MLLKEYSISNINSLLLLTILVYEIHVYFSIIIVNKSIYYNSI